MAVKQLERRLHPRIEIGGRMSYKTAGSDEVREGLLENLSAAGARIWIDEELPAASEVMIRMASDSKDEADLTFKATLLYALPRQEGPRHGYGCSIEASAEWPPEQAQARLLLVKSGD